MQMTEICEIGRGVGRMKSDLNITCPQEDTAFISQDQKSFSAKPARVGYLRDHHNSKRTVAITESVSKKPSITNAPPVMFTQGHGE